MSLALGRTLLCGEPLDRVQSFAEPLRARAMPRSYLTDPQTLAASDLVIYLAPPDLGRLDREALLAQVRTLATTHAPCRVAAVIEGDRQATLETLRFLQDAPAVTGQVFSASPQQYSA